MTHTARTTGAARLAALAATAALAACATSTPPMEEVVADTWPEGPGGSVSVTHDGQEHSCLGVGSIEPQATAGAECDTVYDIGSLTKSFTAAAVLTLQGQGELDVQDPIGEHLGPVPEDKGGITVHHLLTHTAGLIEQLGGDYEPLSRDELVAEAMAEPLTSEPGERFAYSNLGYSLLAAIVEKVSGLGYEEFLAEYLFAPADMHDTGYVLPQWDSARVAVEYDAQGTAHGRPDAQPWAEDGPHWNLRGNGGLLSTASDMARWHRALDGETVLDAEAQEAMFHPHVAEEEGGDTFYGYGWTVSTVRDYGRVLVHDGGNDRSFAVSARFPDLDVSVFWASNRAEREGHWSLEEIAEKITLDLVDGTRWRHGAEVHDPNVMSRATTPSS